MSIQSRMEMFRGEDVTLTFTMSPVVNITGWAITWKMAERPGDTVLLTKTATLSDPTNGVFTVSLASADTAEMDAGLYWFDARRTDSGSKATLADGTIRLKQEITA